MPISHVERWERLAGVGALAETFLDNMAAPPAKEKGELLVVSADGKGIAVLRRELEKRPVFLESERRGNRQMATLACVYSVDRFARTAEDVGGSVVEHLLSDA